MSPAKKAEPIDMPFGLKTRVSPGNKVLDEGPDSRSPIRRDNFEGEGAWFVDLDGPRKHKFIPYYSTATPFVTMITSSMERCSDCSAFSSILFDSRLPGKYVSREDYVWLYFGMTVSSEGTLSQPGEYD